MNQSEIMGGVPAAESEKGREVASDILNADKIRQMLERGDALLKMASMSNQEVEDLIDKDAEAYQSSRDTEERYEAQLQALESKYGESEKNLLSGDYSLLVKEGIIAENESSGDLVNMELVRRIDDELKKFLLVEYVDQDVEQHIQGLTLLQENLKQEIDRRMEARKQEIGEELESERRLISEHYLARLEDLKSISKEIIANPRVSERMQEIAQKEMATEFEGRGKVVRDVFRMAQSLSDRAASVGKRIDQITGGDGSLEDLRDIFGEKDNTQKSQNAFNSLRRKLIDAVINGEGEKQLKKLDEIVPWSQKSGIPYQKALDFLKDPAVINELEKAAEGGSAEASRAIEQARKVLADNDIFRILIGKRTHVDSKTGKEELTDLWAAFEKRKENDKSGVTAARREERLKIENRARELETKIDEVIARGGFKARAPIYRDMNGKKRLVGENLVGVRLQMVNSKAGNACLEIVEFVGEGGGVALGQRFTPNLSSAPQWLREAAPLKFDSKEK